MPGFLQNRWIQILFIVLILLGIGLVAIQIFGTPLAPQPKIKAETLFTIGPLHFTNSMLMGLVVISLLTLFFATATRSMAVVPGRLQNLAEMAVEALLGLVEGVAGKRTGRVIFPLIATLFIFILSANYLALVPGVGSIGGCYAVHETAATGGTETGTTSASSEGKHNEPCPAGTEFVPFLRAPNADLNMTVAMALIAVTVVQTAGVVAHGPGGYLKELFTPVFLGPVHVIGELARVISLSCRLFGNIFGGEVLLLVMYYLLGQVFVGFGVVIFLGLEVLFGGIQALLFALLTLTYITLAVAGHGSSEHHAEEHPAGVVDHPATGTEVHMG